MQNIFNFTCFLLVLSFHIFYCIILSLVQDNIIKNPENLIKGSFFLKKFSTNHAARGGYLSTNYIDYTNIWSIGQKLGFVIGGKITVFIVILQYSIFRMVTWVRL